MKSNGQALLEAEEEVEEVTEEVAKGYENGKWRAYIFTWNNYEEHGGKLWRTRVENAIKGAEYSIYGLEVGEKTETPHVQGYCRFTHPRSITAFRKNMKNTAWVRPARGDDFANQKYCAKGGSFKECGEPVHKCQGERTDLKKVYKKMEEGVQLETMIVEDPIMFHQYGRTLTKLEDIAMRKRWRTEMTKCIWYVGPTGVGKSHKAYEGYNPETHYDSPSDHGWWDGYKQQPIVIVNEFRSGRMEFDFLLQLIDKWPFSVRRRMREPIPFMSKIVLITSPMSPHELFKGSENDRLEQLLERIEIVHLTGPSRRLVLAQKCSTGNRKTVEQATQDSKEES